MSTGMGPSRARASSPAADLLPCHTPPHPGTPRRRWSVFHLRVAALALLLALSSVVLLSAPLRSGFAGPEGAATRSSIWREASSKLQCLVGSCPPSSVLSSSHVWLSEPSSLARRARRAVESDLQSQWESFAARLSEAEREGGSAPAVEEGSAKERSWEAAQGLADARWERLSHEIGFDLSTIPPAELEMLVSFQQALLEEMDRPQEASAPTVWLYSLVAADYDGASLLPHWVAHYRASDISADRMRILVHHNPEQYGPEGLRRVVEVLSKEGIRHEIWQGQYSSEEHLRRKLEVLNSMTADPRDWILIADSDELQHYGPVGAPRFLAAVGKHGGTYVRGEMVDRLERGGALAAVEAAPSLDEQFPLCCHIVYPLYKGSTQKITAFRAFLRSNQVGGSGATRLAQRTTFDSIPRPLLACRERWPTGLALHPSCLQGNHKIVMPEDAASYFGAAQKGQLSPRGGFYGSEDLFPLTPYSIHPEM